MMGNPVVHFEIMGPDSAPTFKFYKELFGWKGQEFPDMNHYVVVDTHAGSGINGAVGQTDDGASYITFYAEVPSVRESLERAESLGGKTVVPETEVPGVVTFGIFSDPEGNKTGVVMQDDQEAPGVSAGDNPPVAWFEVLGKDADKLQDFYSELFGWTIKKSDAGGIPYGEADTGSEKGIHGGIGQTPDGNQVVTIYAQVDDLDKYLEKAESLGAKVAMPASEVTPDTSVAAFIDPQGTLFGLFRRTG